MHMITYMCKNFGVHDVLMQIPKSIYQASYPLPSDFPNNFLKACSYLDIMKDCTNLVQANMEVPFKKIHVLTLRICFEKYAV